MHTRYLGSQRRHLCQNLRPLLSAEHVAVTIFDALCLCKKKHMNIGINWFARLSSGSKQLAQSNFVFLVGEWP